jgi:hypothetical protein
MNMKSTDNRIFNLIIIDKICKFLTAHVCARVLNWSLTAGDMQAKGFLIGGTAGRTTLNGEGLQHEDGDSHIVANTIICAAFSTSLRMVPEPNNCTCLSPVPTFFNG